MSLFKDIAFILVARVIAKSDFGGGSYGNVGEAGECEIGRTTLRRPEVGARSEAVRKLAVMECLPAGLLTPEETAAALPPAFKNLAWFQGFHNTPDLPEESVKGHEKIYPSRLFDSFSVNKSAVTDAEINEYVRSCSPPGAFAAARSLYRTAAVDAKDNQGNAKRKLTMPVLVFGGDGSMNEVPILAMRAAAHERARRGFEKHRTRSCRKNSRII